MFFRAKKCPKLKDQQVRDQVSTTFSEAPQWDLTFGVRISLVAHCSLLLTGTPFSYFWQLFLPTPVSYSYHLLVTSSRYYFLLDQLLLLTNHLSYYFRVLLSGNIITNSYRLLASTILIRYFKKQRYRAALEKGCSENMQQIYRRTSMPKCDFNKTAKQLYCNLTSAWVFSCKFVRYFQNILP